MNLTLDDRLSACVLFVRDGAVLVDVGTDHAYLPTFLIGEKRIKSAIACDINEKPLQSALATINSYDAKNIELRLCDGLAGVRENEFSDVVIAGMGGELIIKILSDCPFIKNDKFNIILQPMSKVYDVRKWLCQNGFYIKAEKAAAANNKIYTVLNAEYRGECDNKDECFYHFGLHTKSQDEKSKKYVLKTKNSLQKAATGILVSDKENEYAKSILRMLQDL